MAGAIWSDEEGGLCHATDVGNAPMAAAFTLAGYVTFERQIDMTWR